MSKKSAKDIKRLVALKPLHLRSVGGVPWSMSAGAVFEPPTELNVEKALERGIVIEADSISIRRMKGEPDG